jgi:hypothetical protein
LFGLASILVIYFLADLLFANGILALGSAALLAIMPLAVFFSRNLQPESPALFFMLLGNLFYLRFIKYLRKYYLAIAGLSIFACWLYSFNFIFGVLPCLFCMPFKTLFKKRRSFFLFVLSLVLPYALIIIAIAYLKQTGQGSALGYKLNFEIFSPSYWQQHGQIISWYIKGENYTPVFAILTLLGLILALSCGSGLLNRYIIGWFLTAVIYAVIFSAQLYQQNFAQMPFVGMVSICSVYTISYLSEALRRLFKRDPLVYFLSACLIISAFFVYKSIYRMHAMVFLGEDVAGESLKEFTKPEDRIFLFTYAQGYGISRYAQRYVGWAEDIDDFQKKEKEFNINYICFYPIEFLRALKDDKPKLFNYIQDHYHVKEVGFLDEPNRLFYIILERGRGSDPKTFLESFAGERRLRTIYKVSGSYIFFYTIRPPAEETKG